MQTAAYTSAARWKTKQKHKCEVLSCTLNSWQGTSHPAIESGFAKGIFRLLCMSLQPWPPEDKPHITPCSRVLVMLCVTENMGGGLGFS